MRIPLRFHILRPWLFGKRHRTTHQVPGREVLKYLIQRSWRVRGRKYLTRVVEDGDWWQIHLRGLDRPLFFPREFSLDEISLVADETFDPRHWHQYLVPETSLRADDVVADCGAAEGLFTLLASSRCRKIYAIEPLPRFVEAMKRTFEGLANVEILPFACGDQNTRARLSANTISSSVDSENGGEGVPIEVRTLDSLLSAAEFPPTFIKADVEGFESALLRGATEIIARQKPRIAITTYHATNDPDEITECLRSLRPDYRFKRKGLAPNGNPVMIHAW